MFGTDHFDPNLFANSFKKHTEKVLAHFQSVGRSEDVLSLNVCAGEGWPQLLSFLGLSTHARAVAEAELPPKFPLVNRNRSFLNSLAFCDSVRLVQVVPLLSPSSTFTAVVATFEFETLLFSLFLSPFVRGSQVSFETHPGDPSHVG